MRHADKPPSDFALLTAEECTRVRDSVFELRRAWTLRSPDVPFYTFGAASYLDAMKGRFASYQAMARVTNPVLAEHFGWLHERLIGALSRAVGAPFFTDTELALPGFHVFLYHESFTRPLAAVHFDLQYEHLDLSRYEEVDRDGQLSITLSIRLPSCGAGLRLFPIRFHELEALPPAERKVRLGELTPELHEYVEGRFVLHSGHQLHQIAPAVGMVPGDERVTMQAHALPVNGGYVLYW